MKIIVKKLISFAVFTLLIVYSSSKLYSEEEYKVLQENVEFDTLPYEEYVNMFKDREIGLGMNTEEIHAKVKERHGEYSKNMSKDFLPNIDIEAQSLFTTTLPYEFNLVASYPRCFYSSIKDQRSCGSCYAFSSTFALAKRYCLQQQQKYSNLDLSPQDMVSCDNTNQKCFGGIPYDTYVFLENYGVSEEICTPYDSFIDQYKRQFYPPCSSICRDYRYSYIKYKTRPNTIRYIDNTYNNNEEAIKQEIYYHGPVSSVLEAFEDLSTYRGGIYTTRETDYSKAGGHAITIVGWGFDNRYGQYWIIANSWGPNWGENGYFKIPFKHCRVANFSVSAFPNTFN